MKKITFFSLLFAAVASHAATFTSLSTGGFQTPATWSVVGSDADGIPDSNDDVIIQSGHTVTQSTTGNALSLTINTGGVFANNNFPFNVYGDFVHNGNMTGTGLIAFRAPGTISGTLTLSAGGNWIFYTNYTIGSNLTVYKGNYMTVAPNRTVTNNGNITLWGGSLTLYSTSTWINAANSSMRVAYDVTAAGTIDASAAPNTFTYYLSGYTQIRCNNATYYNLNIQTQGAATKFLTGALNVLGNLTIGTSVTLNAQNNQIFVGGNWNNQANITVINQSTVEFNGSAPQSISRTTGTEVFNNVNLSNFGSTISLNRDVSVTGTTTIGFCTLDPNGFVYHQRGANWLGGGGSTSTNGRVAFDGTVAQSMGGSLFTDWGNVEINNVAGVTNDAFNRLHGTLTLTAGDFSSAGIFAFTILSSATETGRIGPVTGGTISGTNYTCQRFVSAAAPNTSTPYWEYFSSPVVGCTLLDWDQDMYMSGVGGADGNACCPIFYSVRTYASSVYTNVTSTSTVLAQGVGYMAWLADDMTAFNGISLDVHGLPRTGTVTANCPSGWNLIGNPYMSQVAFSSLTRSSVNNNFYIVDESISNYAFWNGATSTGTGKLSGSGGVINSSQGFLVEATGAGSVTFNETSKTNTSTTFVRVAPTHNTLDIKLTRKDGQPFGAENLITFDELAGDNLDEEDVKALPSPNESSPFMRTLSNDNKELLANGRSQFSQNHSVPLVIMPNMAGGFNLDFNGLDIFTAYECVYLEDVEAGVFYNLKANSHVEFTVTESQKEKQFIVHFDHPVVLANGTKQCPFDQRGTSPTTSVFDPTVFVGSNGINVDFGFTEVTDVQITVLDMLGREIYASTVQVKADHVVLPLPEAHGIYIVRMQHGDEVIAKQISR